MEYAQEDKEDDLINLPMINNYITLGATAPSFGTDIEVHKDINEKRFNISPSGNNAVVTQDVIQDYLTQPNCILKVKKP